MGLVNDAPPATTRDRGGLRRARSRDGYVRRAIPSMAEHLHLGAGALGLALFMPAVGSMTIMPFTGARFIDWDLGSPCRSFSAPIACCLRCRH